MSDFWLIDAWYIRLKTIDVSYQVPTKVLPSWLTNLRVYLNAYNMFTWTSFDKYQQDPEIKSNSAGDAYMNQRMACRKRKRPTPHTSRCAERDENYYSCRAKNLSVHSGKSSYLRYFLFTSSSICICWIAIRFSRTSLSC